MKLERFDKYLILDHLMDGGMAKISRALYLGDHAEKIVVIKTMKKQFSLDETFKKMFMDEIKITFGLVHPNIVQTYDYGFVEEQLYSVMEFCDGKNLKEYLHRLNSQEAFFPIDVSVSIMANACLGLHYAHTYVDKMSGKHAHIIHRDISPHNIMLNFDGTVKIIDFGIAKAESNSEVTKTGTLKGKLGYLAPEYIDGMKLDPRYDEFAIGITLWELLCGRKLFTHSNDIELIKLVHRCRIPPPSTINQAVPKELDEIIMKALSKDRENRYPDLYTLGNQLIRFLYVHYPDFHPQKVVDIAQSLFAKDIEEDKKKLKSFGEINLTPYKNDLNSDTNQHNETNITLPKAVIESAMKKKEVEFDFNFAIDTNNIKNKTHISEQIQQINKSKNTTSSYRTSTKKIEITPISTKKNKTNPVVLALFILFSIAMAYTYWKYKTVNDQESLSANSIYKKNDIKSIKDIEGLKKDKDAQSIFLKNYDQRKMKIFLGGSPFSTSLIGEVSVPKGEKQLLRVQTEGRSHYIMPLNSNKNIKSNLEIPEMPAATYGYLTTTGTCPKGTLFYEIYGEKRASEIPLSGELNSIGFPLKSDLEDKWTSVVYEVQFVSKDKKIQKTFDIKIEKIDQIIDLCLLLNESLE